MGSGGEVLDGGVRRDLGAPWTVDPGVESVHGPAGRGLEEEWEDGVHDGGHGRQGQRPSESEREACVLRPGFAD